MTYTLEQLKALEPYESYFAKATRANWCPYPGAEALRTIYAIYKAATGSRIRLNTACGHCTLILIKDAGRLYFADKAVLEAAKATATPVAEVAEEKPKKKTTKKTKAE